jgi:hypothetical protein
MQLASERKEVGGASRRGIPNTVVSTMPVRRGRAGCNQGMGMMGAHAGRRSHPRCVAGGAEYSIHCFAHCRASIVSTQRTLCDYVRLATHLPLACRKVHNIEVGGALATELRHIAHSTANGLERRSALTYDTSVTRRPRTVTGAAHLSRFWLVLRCAPKPPVRAASHECPKERHRLAHGNGTILRGHGIWRRFPRGLRRGR